MFKKLFLLNILITQINSATTYFLTNNTGNYRNGINNCELAGGIIATITNYNDFINAQNVL